MDLVAVPPGEFIMGSSPRERGHSRYQGPQHRVRITGGFYMGAHEVTQGQYEEVMGTDPSAFRGPRRPVEMVTWNDAREFCRRLSQGEGLTYRLPTEAEWEYACRAGSTTAYSFGDGWDDQGDYLLGGYAWYGRNSDEQTHEVGQKPPNAWGLHGMLGNVREWCQDWFGEYYYWQSPVNDPAGPASGRSRVLRGGSWRSSGADCRSAAREGYTPTVAREYIGFRVVCDPGG
ncbi:MAG: hypothetical protein AMK73_10230 [Planctomycetes bacterium SM23_32]|nr:MAG: hypothetical protein AMK73_10230 [Planctomycetes bacterium SM23_32]